MDKDEQLIDSLLKEHAKHGGVDEQFLTEIEEKITEAERSNIVDLNRNELSSHKDWKKGIGIGVAACAALCVAGTIMWKKDNRTQEVVLDSGSANIQITDAVEDIQAELLSGNPKRVYPKGSSPKNPLAVVTEVGNQDEIESSLGNESLRPSSPSASLAKVIAAESPLAVPVPEPSISVEPSLNFGDGSDFGAGWGGQSGVRDRVLGGQLFAWKSYEEGSSSKYDDLVENSFIAPTDDESKRSTFAIDVDTASYANTRRMIQSGTKVPANAVRIEEMVNYFDYQYKQPEADVAHPFAVQVDSVSCPWNADNKLVRVALQGKDIVRSERPASNLVFLLDVSGSMNATDKLPLLKSSLKYLLEEMDERDSVSMVVYAGASGLVLPATKADAEGRVKILKAMDNLSSGGSTAGGAGIKLAYKIAQENFIKGGVNRVILATDGDFNVGVSGTVELTKIVKESATDGVDISVLGFGRGNLNDEMLESITNNGNGNYSYIDTIKEGRKVLLEDMTGTLVTIAKDVKIQVEFNPNQVKEYRLVGYANRKLPNSAFTDKKADAGEVGAGHNVTAFYEIVPGKALDKSKIEELRYTKRSAEDAAIADVNEEVADELLFVKLAYKQPHEKINDESTYLSVPLKVNNKDWKQADEDFKFASSVALFGMLLRDSEHASDGNLELVEKLAEAGKGLDRKGYREEFIKLVKKVKESE